MKFNIKVSDRTKSHSTFTIISDAEQLYSVAREVLEILQDVGETYITGACHQRNVFVQR